MEKLTLTKVYRTKTSKDGKPLMSKEGRPYEKLAIKAKEYGERWISGFSGRWNWDWREGMQIEAEIEKNEKDGIEYLNLKRPDPIVQIQKDLADHENRIKELEAMVFNHRRSVEAPAIEDKDLPF